MQLVRHQFLQFLWDQLLWFLRDQFLQLLRDQLVWFLRRQHLRILRVLRIFVRMRRELLEQAERQAPSASWLLRE